MPNQSYVELVSEKNIIVFNGSAFVIGFIGNIIACVVILCSRSLYTVADFYLLSLSLSDLLTLITKLLNDAYYYDFYVNAEDEGLESFYVLHSKVGHYGNYWILQTSAYVSILTVTAFTIERYLAICHPFLVKSMSTISRVTKIIITIWFIAALMGLLIVVKEVILNESKDTEFMIATKTIATYVFNVLSILYFYVPITVITVMYILIGRQLKKSVNGRHIAQNDGANAKTLVMFAVIIIIFVLCWTPYNVYVVLYYINRNLNNALITKIRLYLYELARIVYTLPAVVNPIIYTMMSKNFREAVKHLFWKARNKKLHVTASRITNASSKTTESSGVTSNLEVA